MSDDESFLGRWSRRKQEAQKQDKPEPKQEQGETPPEQEAHQPDAAPEPDAPPPELPDVETLDADSDYSVFMAENVPAAIRKVALRKLWRSDPLLANLDGMNEYDEDFTKITPLAKGVAEKIQKMMDENRKAVLGDPEAEKAEEEQAEIAQTQDEPVEESTPEEPEKPLQSEDFDDEDDLGEGEDDF